MTSEAPSYTNLNLYEDLNNYYFETLQNPKVEREVLVINRHSYSLNVSNDITVLPSQIPKKVIPAILGIIPLLGCPYLVLATRVKQVGTLLQQSIYYVVDTDLLPLRHASPYLSTLQESDQANYLQLIKSMLKEPGLYYSPSLDITHSMQRLLTANKSSRLETPVVTADHRFLWNSYMLSDFFGVAERFGVALICGFTGWTPGREVCLLSRRAVQMSGTRFWRRGADDSGNTANFVETEQIVEADDISSFLILRGSIPMSWTQTPNLQWKPKFMLNDDSVQERILNLHLNDLISRYGRLTIVSLINATGSEGRLGQSFTRNINYCVEKNDHFLSQLGYQQYDFHANPDVRRLLQRLDSDRQIFSYLQVTKRGAAMEQLGAFRVNCIDSLDRTNVVQSLICRQTLETQLRTLQNSNPASTLSAELSTELSKLWADHGDQLAHQYAGTKAMKGDITRYGCRTRSGQLNDLNSGLTRYYLNNFADGIRQDAHELFHGRFVVPAHDHRPITSPFESPLTADLLLPVSALISFAIFIYCLLVPGEDWVVYALFWISLTVIFLVLCVRRGPFLVNKPKLVKVKIQ